MIKQGRAQGVEVARVKDRSREVKKVKKLKAWVYLFFSASQLLNFLSSDVEERQSHL